jgi:pyruvate dehydrogenase E1 component beta subunit
MNAPQRAADVQHLTYAQAAALALQQAMRDDARVVALGEDLGRGGVFGQYRGLQAEFGAERVIDTPISEANIMGAAVGMALAGLRPVVEMRVIDFALCAMDELVNQAAKNRYMFGGQGRVPLVARLPIGIWTASAAQHSQSLEAWFAHLPGLLVAAPATPQDNFSLLQAALASGDPVIYMEHKELWAESGEVDIGLPVPFGQARRVTNGGDLTLVTWSRGLASCLAALALPEMAGVRVEVIDLRTLWPWDRDTVFASAARTGHLLVVHESVQVAGFGAEVAAAAAEATGCRVARLGAPRIPVGYAPVLEAESRLSPQKIAAAAQQLLSRRGQPAMQAESACPAPAGTRR